jgi:hypothetical protein
MITKTEAFQEDVKQYTAIIGNLPAGDTRTQATALLNSLIYEVKKMDDMYLDMIYSGQLGTSGNEIREKILTTRKQLGQMIQK